MSKNCIACGKEIDDETVVCELCGANQDEETIEIPTSDDGPAKKGFFRVVTFERFVRYGIPAIVLIIVAVISIIGYSGSYKRSVEKYYKSLCKDKVSKYITVVSDLQFGGLADESEDVVEAFVDEFSSEVKDKVGKVKKVEVQVNSTKKLDDDKLDYIILMSSNKRYDSDSVEKGKVINLTVIITGSEGATTFNYSNVYVLKEDGKWKICTSADTSENK